jgi:hypothetical protein
MRLGLAAAIVLAATAAQVALTPSCITYVAGLYQPGQPIEEQLARAIAAVRAALP